MQQRQQVLTTSNCETSQRAPPSVLSNTLPSATSNASIHACNVPKLTTRDSDHSCQRSHPSAPFAMLLTACTGGHESTWWFVCYMCEEHSTAHRKRRVRQPSKCTVTASKVPGQGCMWLLSHNLLLYTLACRTHSTSTTV